MNPECSASVRVGFGLCRYKLGQIPRAQAAMARALQLDPQNVQALVGSAILELSTAAAGSKDAARRTENAINTISMAYHVDDKHAMVLNHLANHYFWTWSPLKVTLNVECGERTGKVGGSLKHDLVQGDLIRIGSTFVTAVSGKSADGTGLHLRDKFTEASADGLKLFRKDYSKVGDLLLLLDAWCALSGFATWCGWLLVPMYIMREVYLPSSNPPSPVRMNCGRSLQSI